MTSKQSAPQKAIPKAAHTWALFRYERRIRKDKEDGKKYHANAQVRMRSPEPDEDGNVAELFPVGEFSPATVLARWGDGRYFVHFFDKRGQKVGGWGFSVQAPQAVGHVRAGGRDDDDDAAAPHKLPTTQLEWLLYQQAREERQEARRREEARDERDRMREENNERREQDREFLKAVLGSKGGGSSDEHLSLAVERMALNQERGMLAFERRMRAVLDDHQGGEPDEPDDTEPPPRNLDQAAKRVGMRLLSELEKKAPDMLEDAIPKVIEFFKGAGFTPSAALEEEVEAVAQQRRSRVAPNGSARTRS